MQIAHEGRPVIVKCLVAGGIVLLGALIFWSPITGIVSGLCFAAAGFCVYFFRDPPRVIPAGERLILSPADGRILEIVEGKDASSLEPVWIVRIFLSIFNVHIQRAPMAGRIQVIRYKMGFFFDARNPRAALENEQNRILMTTDTGGVNLVVTQIAGLIARRIVCWVSVGKHVEAGEKIGLIRFGSQVDLVMPKSARLRVKAGDLVTAGDTILAEL